MELTLILISFLAPSAAVGILGWLALTGQSRSHATYSATIDRLLHERAALQSTTNKVFESLLERCQMLEEQDGERAELLKRYMNESYDHAVRGYELEKVRLELTKRDIVREANRTATLGDTPMAGTGPGVNVNGRIEDIGATSQFSD